MVENLYFGRVDKNVDAKRPRLVSGASLYCFGTYLVARWQLKDMGVPAFTLLERHYSRFLSGGCPSFSDF